jgi:hypothetical protein
MWDWVPGLVIGLIEGGARAAALLAQGKLEEARDAAFATIDEAHAKKLAHEAKHAERDADIRGTGKEPGFVESMGRFDVDKVIDPNKDGSSR